MVSPQPLAAPFRSVGEDGRHRRANDRQHDDQGSSIGRRRKRGASTEAIGRSRGGRTTKIHAVADRLGRLISFTVTPGQLGDAPQAEPWLAPLPVAQRCLADTAYDSDALRRFLLDRGTLPVIPNNPTRKRLHLFDDTAYRQRNLIERLFCRLKDRRRIATRYDKLATNFAAAIAIATIVLWWT